MDGWNHDQRVMQGMLHLNVMTHLDIAWYDSDHQKLHGFQSSELPQVLDFHPEREYPVIDALCRPAEGIRSCVATTSSFLEFVFIPLPEDNHPTGMVRIGPFLTGPLTEPLIASFIVSLSLPLSHSQTLHHYFASVPMLPADAGKSLGHIGLNLFGHPCSMAQVCLYRSPGMDRGTLSQYETAMEEDTAAITRRYDLERRLMRAVASGRRELLTDVMVNFSHSGAMNSLMNRFPENPLRAVKNLAIVLNTILRHAAEQGGLHPIHIHKISSKYALLIEHARTRTAVQQLQAEMPGAYTDLVRQYAFPDVSPHIRKILDHLLLHLSKPLSQQAVAAHFGMRPSNLANQFKNETGQTVTGFINARRIGEACHYLQNSDLPIQEISRFVGINDANYFSRLFREKTGCTPLQYRRNMVSS